MTGKRGQEGEGALAAGAGPLGAGITSALLTASTSAPPLQRTQGLFLFLFGRTLYFELDVDGEMQKGSLPGAISLAHKFVPASKAVLGRTLEAVQVGLGRKGGA